MGISINFNPDDLRKAMAKTLRSNLESRARSVLCPTHGERPHLEWPEGLTLRERENPKFQIVACCEEAAKLAQAALPDKN